MNCCCHWGAAVSGEWPEFECFACPIHKGDMGDPTELCKRHARICLSDGFVVTDDGRTVFYVTPGSIPYAGPGVRYAVNTNNISPRKA